MEGTRNPLENSLVLSLTLSSFGTTRKVKESMIGADDDVSEAPIKTDADKNLLKISKKIFQSNATDQIKTLYGEIRGYLSRYTIVGAMFRPGMYLSPYDHVTSIESYLREKVEMLDYWKFQLGEEYDGVKNDFQRQLGTLYNEADYPSSETVKSKYSIEYEWLAMNVPAALQHINSDIWQQEQQKAQIRVRAVADRIEEILTASMQELIEHLVDRLTDTDDGKRKKWRGDMVEKAREFFDTFRSRNLTGSEGLNDIAEQGLSLLNGIDLDSLKDQAAMRERVRTGFESIKSNMAAMITVAPRRSLNLQDEVQAETDAVHQTDYEAEVASVTPDTNDSDVNPDTGESDFLDAQEHVEETAANAWNRPFGDSVVVETRQTGEELRLF